MTDIGPVPVGTVRDLVGTMLRASLGLDPGRALEWFEVQVGPRAEPDDPTWEHPLWRFRSDMPRIASIDGVPVHDGMEVKSARPTVRLRTDAPVSAFRWELRQDGAVVEKDRSTQGISTCCIRRSTRTCLAWTARPRHGSATQRRRMPGT
jgi:hypothetical protein